MTIKENIKTSLSRKQFLQPSAAGTAAGLLTGYQAAPAAAPTDTAIPATPTVDAAATRRKDLMRRYPDAPSRVVKTRGAGVWEGTALSPDDRVAIKVNAFYNSLIWIHFPLVKAVTDSLQDAGIPAAQIVLYDQTGTELETAGFAVNHGSEGIRCYGSDKSYKDFTDVGGTAVQLSPILADCTALINMPVLIAHMLAGITFALKNHFGSIQYPGALHASIARRTAELNALPEIKDRTRLVIGISSRRIWNSAMDIPTGRRIIAGIRFS